MTANDRIVKIAESIIELLRAQKIPVVDKQTLLVDVHQAVDGIANKQLILAQRGK